MAFDEIEPFGPEAAFWRTGLIASLLANIHRDPKKRAQPFSPQDFMPASAPKEPKHANPGAMTQAILALFPPKGKKKHGRTNRLRAQRRKADGKSAERPRAEGGEPDR